MPNHLGRWVCKLCEASGIGDRDDYAEHYETEHYDLELERHLKAIK